MYFLKPKHNKNIIYIFLIYFFSHGVSLGFLGAEFYDDILIFHQENMSFIFMVSTMAEYFRLFIWNSLKFFNPWAISLISFCLFFFSSITFYKILINFYSVKDKVAYLFIVLYLILPFGLIKFSLSIVPYLICINFFLIGWFLITKSKILSLLFFCLSFNMQSLLVLYALPILSYFQYSYPHVTRSSFLYQCKLFLKFLVRKFYFLILPFLFFFIKFFFFKPLSDYVNYNREYDLKNLLIFPVLQFLDLFRNNLSIGFLVFGAILAFLVIKYFFNFFNDYNKVFKNNFNILTVFVGIFGSLIPYWVITHTPTFTGYSSRHQLLLLISVPFLIIFLLNFFKIQKIKLILFLIFTLSFAVNFKVYADYYIDYWRQIKTIQFVNENKEIFNKHNLIVDNNTYRNSSVTYGPAVSSIKNGFLKKILGSERHFLINISQLKEYSEGKFDHKFNKIHMASEHKRSNEQDYLLFTTESHGFLKFNFILSKISPIQN